MRDETIADLLLARLGDDRPGLRSRERTWTWDEVVRESAARASLARELRRDGPFHIGVLLENVPEYVLWLGGPSGEMSSAFNARLLARDTRRAVGSVS